LNIFAGMMINVIQIGMGPIGIECARAVLSRPGLELVGCVDNDPGKAGKDLARLLGGKPDAPLKVVEDISHLDLDLHNAVAVQTTGSFLREIAPQLLSLLERGLNVVSSAEELLMPFFTDSVLARKIDRKAKEKGLSVLGAGINPGFLLDYLPLILCGACREVEKIRAVRVVDSATRRRSFQAKMGAGIDLAEFERRRDVRSLGHVGSRQSVAYLAQGLDWRLDTIEEKLEPVLADRDYRTEYFSIRRGSVAGIHEVARGVVEGKEKIVLDLSMYVGAPRPHDLIVIKGNPGLKVRVEGGTPGDEASVAILVNSVVRAAQAPPGLLTAKELPPGRRK